MIIKLLGALDLASASAFLLLVFGIDVFAPYLLFCAGLLLVKGFFVLGGDILSVIDLYSSIVLITSIFISLPIIFLWIPAFLLFAKGVVSFL